MTLNELLTKHHACDDAKEWAATQPDLATAWRRCTRIDWMCWLASRVTNERTMRHLACDFAESAWPYAGDGEALLQCILTVEIARGFAEGTEVTETRDAAGDAAGDVAWDAARAAAGDAAGDAARAAAGDAARDAAWGAASAAAREKYAGWLDEMLRAAIKMEG